MTQPTQSTANGPLDHLASACRYVAMAGLVVITLVQAWQVFGRYVLNDSPGWTEPVSVFFMGLTVMLAAAVGVREGTHFSFSNIQDGMPPTIRKFVRVFLYLLTMGVAILLGFWGATLVASNWDIAMAGAPLPAGIRYLPFTIGAFIMALFAGERMIAIMREKAN